jgi:hypothetical protein
MQQRQPRLGDVVDDYCPRERRVTNHAVVAMVGDEVKQTRCTTCDAEHDYKHAKVPPQRKKKDVPGALYQQVLDGIPRVVPTPEVSDEEPDEGAVQAVVDDDAETAPLGADEAPAGEHEGPVHRRLIRATLPRLPGAEPPVRREPEFTMRSPAHNRPGKPKNGFRGGGGGGGMHRSGGPMGQGQGAGNGNRSGKRHGRPGGDATWNRSGQATPGGRGPGGQRPDRGGKKRSR